MEVSLQECVLQWLEAVELPRRLHSACGDGCPIISLEALPLFFHVDCSTILRVVNCLFFDRASSESFDPSSARAALVSFLIDHFTFLCTSPDLRNIVEVVVTSACNANDPRHGASLEKLWGWIVALWFGAVGRGREPKELYALLPDGTGERLQSLMQKSIRVLGTSASEKVLDFSDELLFSSEDTGATDHCFETPEGPNTLLGRSEVAAHKPDAASRSVAEANEVAKHLRILPPSSPTESRGKDLKKYLRELGRENCEFYSEITQLQRSLTAACDRNDLLERELGRQAERIRELTHNVGDKHDAEASMASELFELKQQLTMERTTSSRLREKTAWLQAQLFRNKRSPRVSTSDESDGCTTAQIFGTRAFSFSTAPSPATATELCVKQLQADSQRHLAALQAAEARRDCAVHERDGLKAQVDQLKGQLLKFAVVEAEKRHFQTELAAQRAANATQFDIIHDLNSQLCQLEKDLESARATKQVDDVVKPESLGTLVETALQQKVEQLLDERAVLADELAELRRMDTAQIQAERLALEEQVKVSALRLKEAEAQLVSERSERDRQETTIAYLRRDLEVQRDAFQLELQQQKAELAVYESRAAAAEADRQASQATHEDWATARKEIMTQLSEALMKKEAAETENRGLRAEVERLHQRVAETREASSGLRQEIEETLAPQVNNLKLALKQAEKSTELLSGEVQLKDILIKEKDDQIARTTAMLEKAQSRLTSLERQQTAYENNLQQYGNRASGAEAELKKSRLQCQRLETEIRAVKNMTAELQRDLENSRSQYTKLRQNYDELESQRVLRADECRRAEKELLFYRTEFERLANTTLTPVSSAETAREGPFRDVLEELSRQLEAGKQELANLNRTVEERIKILPTSTGDHKEFEIVDIVEHFEREKATAAKELRAITLRLADAEAAYQKLLREHQALGKAHSTLLRDFIDLDKRNKTAQCKPSTSGAQDASVGPSEPSQLHHHVREREVALQKPSSNSHTTKAIEAATPMSRDSRKKTSEPRRSIQTSAVSNNSDSRTTTAVGPLTVGNETSQASSLAGNDHGHLLGARVSEGERIYRSSKQQSMAPKSPATLSIRTRLTQPEEAQETVPEVSKAASADKSESVTNAISPLIHNTRTTSNRSSLGVSNTLVREKISTFGISSTLLSDGNGSSSSSSSPLMKRVAPARTSSVTTSQPCVQPATKGTPSPLSVGQAKSQQPTACSRVSDQSISKPVTAKSMSVKPASSHTSAGRSRHLKKPDALFNFL